MQKLYYKTSELAKEVNIHSNTVRLYESWGYLREVKRRKNGYRQFERIHIDQLILIRKALNFTWFSGRIRNYSLEIINNSAIRNFYKSCELSINLKSEIELLLKNAHEAIDIVNRWLNKIVEQNDYCLSIAKASKILDVSTDTIRNWERNGLIKLKRNIANRYRSISNVDIERLKVIKVLRLAGFSTMSILRMLTSIDKGTFLMPQVLIDTPGQNEDIIFATDKWLSKLNEWYNISLEIVDHTGLMKIRYSIKIK